MEPTHSVRLSPFLSTLKPIMLVLHIANTENPEPLHHKETQVSCKPKTNTTIGITWLPLCVSVIVFHPPRLKSQQVKHIHHSRSTYTTTSFNTTPNYPIKSLNSKHQISSLKPIKHISIQSKCKSQSKLELYYSN